MEQKRHPDPFAEIAFREHPGNGDGLEEIRPPSYEKTYFVEGKDQARKPASPSYEAQLARFQIQLQQLREQYRPYLRNLTT